EQRNLYRIDDLLLRAGAIGLFVVLGGLALFAGLASSSVESEEPRLLLRLAATHAAPILVALLCPIVALRVGWTIRRREKKILGLWRLLRQQAEISVPDLLANSHFTQTDLDRGVRLLNTRGLGHYVWDRERGTIQDGRLRTSRLHVEKCEVCGGSIALDVPLLFREAPLCPYCGDPVSVDALEARREEALDGLREAAPRTDERDGAKVPFSIPLFAILMIVCWPAGVAYAWYRCQHPD
ncbi:MAG: hypothetical protein KC616_26230, partial [Myxococcales bacterium]|nr:hypothetical protein [Myxococcales bacterium]